MQITRKVLILEFKCTIGSNLNIMIQKPKADLTQAIINPVAQQLIAAQVIKNESNGKVVSLSKVYYSEVAIQDIAL